MGKLRWSSTRRNSWPTAPLAPTMATFILVGFLVVFYFVRLQMYAFPQIFGLGMVFFRYFVV